MQLLAADDFTYNSHALKYMRGEVRILMKTRILQIGGGQSVSRVIGLVSTIFSILSKEQLWQAAQGYRSDERKSD